MSSPHINGLYGAGCYGISCRTLLHQFWPPGCWGHIYWRPSTSCTRVLEAKIAAARECFKFSQRSASNDNYIAEHDSSSPTLPTINDICCKIENTSNTYSCTVYALQFQDSLQSGWLKHRNRVQLALAHRHSI